MKEASIIMLARMACGTAILVTHMLTGANNTFVLLGVFLLGVPFELVKHGPQVVESESNEKEN